MVRNDNSRISSSVLFTNAYFSLDIQHHWEGRRELHSPDWGAQGLHEVSGFQDLTTPFSVCVVSVSKKLQYAIESWSSRTVLCVQFLWLVVPTKPKNWAFKLVKRKRFLGLNFSLVLHFFFFFSFLFSPVQCVAAKVVHEPGCFLLSPLFNTAGGWECCEALVFF